VTEASGKGIANKIVQGSQFKLTLDNSRLTTLIPGQKFKTLC
jgi:hypothetical protein